MRRIPIPFGRLSWSLSLLLAACSDPGTNDATDGGDATETTGDIVGDSSGGTEEGTEDGTTSGTDSGTGASPDMGSGTDSDSDSSTDTGDPACDAEVFELPGEFFHPEGIAAHDGTLFVGSLATGEIVRIDICEQTVDSFSSPGDPVRNAVGLRVDLERNLLWVCNSDVEFNAPPSVDALDLQTGALVTQHAFADLGFCNDIALDDAGNVYATDSAGHQLHRIAAEDVLSNTPTESWLADPAFLVEPGEFGLNGIAYDPDGALWFSNYQLGELYRVPIAKDGSPGELEIRALDGELPLPDGVLWHDGGLLAVSGGNALVELELTDPVAVTTVADGFDFGTTVAVDDGAAWVAEGQLDHLFGIDRDPPSLPFLVVRAGL